MGTGPRSRRFEVTVKHEIPEETRAPAPPPAPARRTAEWLMGIFGVVGAFVGLFIFFGPENQSLGFWGDWSWQVGEIDALWGYGFLIAGVLLLVGAVMMLFQERRKD
jgi:hypothetical protein